MKRMLWILNPHAGRGAMSGKIIGCVTAFQQAGYDVTIYITQGAQDATRVARERAGEFDRIVCAELVARDGLHADKDNFRLGDDLSTERETVFKVFPSTF